MYHLPGLPADLPHPEVLWARVGAYAAVCAALGRTDCAPGTAEIRFRPAPGTGLRLVRVAGRRFLLLGHEPGSAFEASWTRPVDPFEGAPEALPWDWIDGLPRPDFAYWWEGAWARAAYSDDRTDDGLAATAGWCADTEGFTLRTARAVLGADGAAGAAGVRAAAAGLEARARARTLDARALAAVLDRAAPGTDPAAGLGAARRLGLTGERAPRERGPGGSAPATRLPALGGHSRMLLLGDAMRAAAELPGRGGTVTALAADAVPDGRSEEVLARAAALVRGHLLGAADRRAVIYRAPREYGIDPADRVPGLHAELEGLRRDEAAGGDRWLFARLTVTPRDAALERAYDHWPEWAPGPVDGAVRRLGFRHATGEPDAPEGLRAEMDRRSPDRRPGWAALLSACAADRPPPPGVPGRPSVPPLRIGPERRAALLDGIAARMRGLAGDAAWSRLRLTHRALAGYAGGTLTVTGPGGERVLAPDADLRAALEVLRSATYVGGRGAWFTVDIVVGPASGWRVSYDRDGEPAFSLPPRAFDFALDLRYFPRDPVNVPSWLAERLRTARA
ncbi:hypothetical protein ACFWF4_28525 [Nocardiopsis flavescens]|uniref:hypothetical protein n=1 Tax=Nocardiopsis flavescens TaxID=758803 RepID=UPI003657CAD0